ncbi:hypothetical protein [Paenibacillus lemnae]|uniref:Uncharacterized protein n=1 Tax=Paenibacillus lemnae TaxID=1330551 RepID=A0A848MA84_PAELE|nr:hypothetical protein [Paenibacillus lemnae]NMO96823.1 hypothetical protein [Paenibacillus lemnae]
MGTGLTSVLQEGDQLFNGFYGWLSGQFDSDSGGFYYAASSRSAQLGPDIESTSQALNIMERCGAADMMGNHMKQQIISFYQSRQDPKSGYFYDRHPDMPCDEVMVGRALGYSQNSLRKLGASPLHPVPDHEDLMPGYCQSPAKYAEWLRSISLINSWRGCDRLCNSAPYLARMPVEKKTLFLDEAWSYFDEIQDVDSGLWGEGSPYVRISGTFKLLTYYKRFGRPLPGTAAIYTSLLYALRNEKAVDMCYIRNPISLLSAMEAAIPQADLEEITTITLTNMSKLKRSDGGFSREMNHSPAAPNVAQVKPGEYYPDMPAPVPIGQGLAEGDMNAGTQAVLIRYSLRKLAELPDQDLPQSKLPFTVFLDEK